MISFALDEALAGEMDAAVGVAGVSRSMWLREAVREHLDRIADVHVAPAVETMTLTVRVGDPPCDWEAAT